MTSGGHDAVVVGDGPAGAAAAQACAVRGLDTVLVGVGAPWTNTYGVWLDEVPVLPDEAIATRCEQVIVGAAELRRVDRAYAVLDGDGLRRHLGVPDRLRRGTATAITPTADGVRVGLDDGAELSAGWVIDARGAATARPRAWQTAYGIVVDEAAASELVTTDAVTLMDWSWSGTIEQPSFLYAVPVAAGWLVEHTVLAASPEVPPERLRPGLVDRLGATVVAHAEERHPAERVRIPMGLPVSVGEGRVVRFGAAAGSIHPATGYSVGAALASAPRLAAAIAEGSDPHDAVWPASARRARALHDFGLGALLRLDAHLTATFFDAFFRLPAERWSDYLRPDASPAGIARVMADVFRRVPWSVRRELMRGDLRSLRGLVAR